MKTRYLFPHQLKKIGWLLFLPGIVLGILFLIYEANISFFDMHVLAISGDTMLSDAKLFAIGENNILDELASVLIIVGASLIAFSKEKSEDEYISKIRLDSLVWATYVNYAILLLAVIFVYDMSFLWVLIFNMFTLLIFFLVRFNWVLMKNKNQISDEE